MLVGWAYVPIFLLSFLFLVYLVWYADKRLALVVGGILVLVGFFFMPWVEAGGTVGEFTVSGIASGWDITQGEINVTVGEVSATRVWKGESYPYLALIGGILTLIGAVGMIACPKTKELAVLPVVGGILAFAGALLGLVDIKATTEFVDFGVLGRGTITSIFSLGLLLTLFVGFLCLMAVYYYVKNYLVGKGGRINGERQDSHKAARKGFHSPFIVNSKMKMTIQRIIIVSNTNLNSLVFGDRIFPKPHFLQTKNGDGERTPSNQ